MKGISIEQAASIREIEILSRYLRNPPLDYEITEKFAKINLRLVSEMKDAARSAKQNIREGYKRGTIGEFIHGINISRGSLEELEGDVEDCFEDGLISKEEFNRLSNLIHNAL